MEFIKNFISLSVLVISNIIILFSLIYFMNLLGQRKSRHVKKNKESAYYRPSFDSWYDFVRIYKKPFSFYSVIFGAIMIISVINGHMDLAITMLSLMVWDYFSINWPQTYIFGDEGMCIKHPFLGLSRGKMPLFFNWDFLNDIVIIEDQELIVYKIDEIEIPDEETIKVCLFHSLPAEHQEKIVKWLKNNNKTVTIYKEAPMEYNPKYNVFMDKI